MPDQKSIIKAFLSNYVLFSSLDETILDDIIDSLEVKILKPGDFLYLDGESSKDFYIVWSGRLQMTKPRDRDRLIATLIIGDFFGEDGLFNDKRFGSVQALETSKVFKIDFSNMIDLFSRAPKLRKLLLTSARSRKLVYDKRLKWLGEDEALYFVARKHFFFLITSLIFPILILLASSIFSLQSLLSLEFASLSFWIPASFALLAILWMIWLVIDWENDYYVVTSQRAIWFEKTIAIYDSRQEAPLDMVLTINRVFNPTLRMLIDYGTVIIKTYTGSIVMRWAENPDEMVFFIEGFKARARAIARQYENQAMEVVIQRRLSGRDQQIVNQPAGEDQSTKITHTKKGFFAWLSNALKMRFEEGEYITYRKHWFILIKKTLFPGTILLGLFILVVYTFSKGIFDGLSAILVWSMLFLMIGLWWLYQYVDWRNDIYVLTLDKIFDIERKPLTREEKREASLGNILSLENARIGLIGLILNFGTVTLNVGNEKLTFDHVYNPVQVQYEISDRMYAYRKRKEEQDAARDRERVADWLMAYHRQINYSENNENLSNEGDF